ncbi:MAG: hypothetical protein ACLFV6_09590 [Spirulinaceae cyanobacterium]
MIVALAGRRIDAPNQEMPRFPLANVEKVRNEIRQQFQNINATHLVCSGACGADLLALDVALELDLKCCLVLPFDPERFRTVSVVDRPGDWGPLYDRVLAEITAKHFMLVLQEEDDEAGFIAVNGAILDQAIALNQKVYQGNKPPVAMIVWNGCDRGEGDVTHALMNKARDRGFKITEISTC